MSLSRNVFKILLLLTGIVAVYIGVNFFIDLHRYFELSHEVAAKFEKWEVEEVRSGKFIISSSYSYSIDGVSYHGKYRIKKPVYPNIYLAREHLEKWKGSQDWVWVNPKNPHQSALIRSFPKSRDLSHL